jgi:hypothetical protein
MSQHPEHTPSGGSLQVLWQQDRMRVLEAAWIVEEQRRVDAVAMRQEVEEKWHRVRSPNAM